MESQPPAGDPKLRALSLRVQSAEESLLAAKLYCKVTHLETTAANLMLSSLKHKEQAELATARGQRFYDKMKEHEAALAKDKSLQETLGPEILRAREKAMKLSAEAAAHEKRSNEAEESARSVLAESEGLRRERDKHLIEAKRLEAEAVRVESMF